MGVCTELQVLTTKSQKPPSTAAEAVPLVDTVCRSKDALLRVSGDRSTSNSNGNTITGTGTVSVRIALTITVRAKATVRVRARSKSKSKTKTSLSHASEHNRVCCKLRSTGRWLQKLCFAPVEAQKFT